MSFQACCWASRRSSPVELSAAWVVMVFSWVALCASKNVMMSGCGAWSWMPFAYAFSSP